LLTTGFTAVNLSHTEQDANSGSLTAQRSVGGWRLFNVDGNVTGVADNPELPDAGRADAAAAAVTGLFRGHHLELVRLALLMTGDVATAEDVVQDAFEQLHRRWPSLRRQDSGLAYVRSSVLNGCRSVHRRALVARRHAARLAEPPASGADTAAGERSDLMFALLGLPRRQREVLVLRYYADLDVAEIAATLRIGPSAVRSTAARGLAALARVLQEADR
jgi:RNA polymerase sigma-70 factor (sigma-E family)